MSFISALFYDKLMSEAEKACLDSWRQDLLKHVYGEVLEIGAGTGANVEHYPERVTKLVLTEPDKHMRKKLLLNVSSHEDKNIYVSNGTAEQILAGDESFDFIVASLVCCSVSSLEASLKEIKRVLKHGGVFIFLEHVAAADGTSRRRWQNWLNPIWKSVSGNCHLNRETEDAILGVGFNIREIKRESMRRAMPIVRPTIRGLAEKV